MVDATQPRPRPKDRTATEQQRRHQRKADGTMTIDEAIAKFEAELPGWW